MTHPVSAKCDSWLNCVTAIELQRSCREKRFAGHNAPRRLCPTGCTCGWHVPCFRESTGRSSRQRSWTASRPNSRNTGSPTGRVRPMAVRWNVAPTNRRPRRNRKRWTRWPSACPRRAAFTDRGDSPRRMHNLAGAAVGPNSSWSAVGVPADRSPLPAIFLPAGFFLGRLRPRQGP